MPDDTFWARLWEIVCDHEDLVKIGFAIPVTLLVLQLLTSPAIEPGTPSYVIMVFNFSLLVPLALFMLFVMIRCSRREPIERF